MVFEQNHIIEGDLNVTVVEKCRVQIGEPVNDFVDVIVNTTYGSITLLQEYLQNPNFLLIEGNNSSVVLKESTPVLSDSFVTIKKARIIDMVLELNGTSKSDDILVFMDDYVEDSEFSVGHVEVIDQGNGIFSVTVSVVDDQLDDFKNTLLNCVKNE